MNIFDSALIFKNSACKCSVERRHGALRAEPKSIFVLAPDDAQDDYTYILNFKEHAELVREKLYRNYGSHDPKTNGIISQILSLANTKSPEAYITFFQKNGFFLPLDTFKHTFIDASAIIHLCNRIFAIYELRKLMSDKSVVLDVIYERNRQMLKLIIYLLYSQPLALPQYLRGSQLENEYIQPHEFTRVLYSPDFDYPSVSAQTVCDSKQFQVPDAIIKRDKIDTQFYNCIYSGVPAPNIKNSDDHHFRQLVAMHCSSEIKGDTKLLVDFFYHYQMNKGVLPNLTLMSVPIKDYPLEVDGRLSKVLHDELPRVAKVVICEEINYYVSTVQPFLNHATRELNWKVDSLLQAVYLGIMHDYLDDYIYRRCERNDCKHPYYPLKAGVTNKHHCCTSCARVKNTRNTRARAKEDAKK